jgi:hypothetical protein
MTPGQQPLAAMAHQGAVDIVLNGRIRRQIK